MMLEIRESLTSSLQNLRAHALRSALSVLGIIFGVGAVIAMLSIGAGAEDQALQVIRQMGLRNILI
jgi:putative ABC transport system permease protein